MGLRTNRRVRKRSLLSGEGQDWIGGIGPTGCSLSLAELIKLSAVYFVECVQN